LGKSSYNQISDFSLPEKAIPKGLGKRRKKIIREGLLREQRGIKIEKRAKLLKDKDLEKKKGEKKVSS